MSGCWKDSQFDSKEGMGRKRRKVWYAPPMSDPPARSANATIPSFTNIGYFSLRLTSAHNAAATSFCSTKRSRPCATNDDSGSSCVDAEDAGAVGVEKSDRTRLTRMREASERRRVSFVRVMRESTLSRGIEVSEGAEVGGGGIPSTSSEFGTARRRRSEVSDERYQGR